MTTIKDIYNNEKKNIVNSFDMNDLIDAVINSRKMEFGLKNKGLVPSIFTNGDNELRDLVKAHIQSLTSVANTMLNQQDDTALTYENISMKVNKMLQYAIKNNGGYNLSYSIFCDFDAEYEYFPNHEIDMIFKYIKNCVAKGLDGYIGLEWRSMCDSGYDATFDIKNGKLEEVKFL